MSIAGAQDTDCIVPSKPPHLIRLQLKAFCSKLRGYKRCHILFNLSRCQSFTCVAYIDLVDHKEQTLCQTRHELRVYLLPHPEHYQ